jgi:hypothetical protein
MKIRIGTIIGLASACIVGATVFHGVSANVDAGGLVVAWTETGLPKTETPFAYSVSAKATAAYGCFTKSGNNPADRAKRVVFTAEAMQKLMVQSVTGGTVRAKARLGIPPVDGRLSCPPGLSARLSSVSYSGITIRNHTTGTATKVLGTYAKTFLVLK